MKWKELCFARTGPYRSLYTQAIDKLQKDFDLLEHIKSKKMVATSLRALAILEKGRVERMEYIKENVIEINPDEYDKNRELQM